MSVDVGEAGTGWAGVPSVSLQVGAGPQASSEGMGWCPLGWRLAAACMEPSWKTPLPALAAGFHMTLQDNHCML